MTSGSDRPGDGPLPSRQDKSAGSAAPPVAGKVVLPARPQRPVIAKEDEAAAKRRGCLAVLMAGMLVMICLVGLAFLSQGFMIPVVMIAGCIFFYVFVHYIIWGWWLGSLIREEARQDEEARAALKQAENPPR